MRKSYGIIHSLKVVTTRGYNEGLEKLNAVLMFIKHEQVFIAEIQIELCNELTKGRYKDK